jgi:hypothetical protein
MTVPASPPVTASLFAIFATFANFTPYGGAAAP